MSKPIIAVVGATGSQGGSVVNHLHASGKWHVRALTRDTGSSKAKELKEQGIEVVKCDILVPSDLKRAFEGAYGVFGVTVVDFKIDLDDTTQGINIVNAAKTQKVQHVVLSTLPNVEQLSNGKRKVKHFTRKAIFEQYARKEAQGAFAFTAVQATGYYENQQKNAYGPRPGKDGKLAITMCADPTSKIPMFSVADTGGVVAVIFDNKNKYNGKTIPLVGDYVTFQEVVAQLSRVAGKEIGYNFVPEKVFATFFPGAAEIGDMFGFINEYGYINEKQNPEKTKDLWLAREAYPKMRTLTQWAEDVNYSNQVTWITFHLTLSIYLRVPEDHQKIQTGVEANKRFLAALIQCLGTKKDGKISREELLAGVEKHFIGKTPETMPDWWKENMKQFYETADLGNDGVLSYEELAHNIRGTTPTETDENIQASYEKILKLSKTGKFDPEAALAGVFVWATSTEPEPELDRIFTFWRKVE